MTMTIDRDLILLITKIELSKLSCPKSAIYIDMVIISVLDAKKPDVVAKLTYLHDQTLFQAENV